MEPNDPTPITPGLGTELVSDTPQPVRRCAFPPCGAELNEAPPFCRRHNELAQFIQFATLNLLVNLKILTISKAEKKPTALVDASGTPIPEGNGND